MQNSSELEYCSKYYPLTKITFNYIISKNLKEKITNVEGKDIESVASKVLEHYHENASASIGCHCGETRLVKCDYSKSERILFSKILLIVDGVTYTARIHGFGEHDDAKDNNKMYKFYFCDSKKTEKITLK